MRQAVISVIAVVILVLSLVVPVSLANREPAYAGGGNNNCVVQITGPLGVVICGGQVIEQVPLPTIKVTVPGPAGPTVTVRPPQATHTVLGPTHTITVPGPTQTINGPRQTVTVKSSAGTETKTVTVSPSGQPNTTSGTVVPDVPSGESNHTITKWIKTPAKIIGISTLTLLLLVGLLLLGMWAGYYLGRKDSDRENASILRALSDQLLIRGKHR